jgi:hypothetical protein
LFVGKSAVRMKQGAAYENDLERHRLRWKADDLWQFGFEPLDDRTVGQFGNQMLLGLPAN